MVKTQRTRRLAVLLFAFGVTAATAAPVALAAGDDGIISGGGGPNPNAERMSQERGWVAPFAKLHFGAEPYEAVKTAATKAAEAADCSISATAATNLTLSTTWPEVSPSGASPSPMTLSRYDDQTSLADPKQRAEGLFFNPGVGLWQLDSAGLGTKETAATAIDSASAATKMASHMVDSYCSAINGGSSEASARASAWQPWHACDSGACEDVYKRLNSDGVTKDADVDRYGGAEKRKCTFEGAEYDCLYIDPSAAQGEDAWTAPDYGPAPVPDPFYAFTYEKKGVDYEVRYWLKGDSGASTDVSASRELGVDARSKLSWAEESTLCDTTTGTGNC